MPKWLVLDVNYLCWRSYHTGMRDFMTDDIPTGCIFGLMKDILYMERTHDTKNIAFCFDSKESHRKKIFPEYKSDREIRKAEQSQEERRKYIIMLTQIDILRQDILPYIGFKNIFHEEGFEADDLIASFCLTNKKADITIVSSDQDLYQLLGRGVVMWNPTTKVFTSEASFAKKWNLYPRHWSMVKAIAGCKSDSIPGVPGIGEKTAADVIAGTVKKGKKYDAIVGSRNLIVRNLKLTTLPFVGTPECEIRKDERKEDLWHKVAKHYGMTSLIKPRPKFRN